MKFSLHTDEIGKLQAGLCGLLCFEEGTAEGVIFQAFDKQLGGLLSKVVTDEQFKGKKGQTLELHTLERASVNRLLLIGAGPRKDFQAADLRGFAAKVMRI